MRSFKITGQREIAPSADPTLHLGAPPLHGLMLALLTPPFRGLTMRPAKPGVPDLEIRAPEFAVCARQVIA